MVSFTYQAFHDSTINGSVADLTLRNLWPSETFYTKLDLMNFAEMSQAGREETFKVPSYLPLNEIKTMT